MTTCVIRRSLALSPKVRAASFRRCPRLRKGRVISTLPLPIALEALLSIFKAIALRSGPVLVLGAPLMSLPPSLGGVTRHKSYALVLKALWGRAPLQVFRKTRGVLSTDPAITLAWKYLVWCLGGNEIRSLAGKETPIGE